MSHDAPVTEKTLALPIDAEGQMADAIRAFRKAWNPSTEDQFASWLVGWMRENWSSGPSTQDTAETEGPVGPESRQS